MANQRKVGLKIEIDGEKEYKQAISELNKGNQVLASELKLVSEQFKGNEDSIEALNAKGDVLSRQLAQQEDKVKTLRAALQNAATKYGEADKRTQEWQVQLNNAEAAQIKLERAVEENNAAIANQGAATDDAGEKMTDFSSKTVAAMGAAAAGIGAVTLAVKAVGAGIEAAQKLNEMTLEQAHWADDLLTEWPRPVWTPRSCSSSTMHQSSSILMASTRALSS